MEKPDTVQHYEEMLAMGESVYLDPIELDEIFHWYAESQQLDKLEPVLQLALRLHPEDIMVQQMDAEYSLNTGDSQVALDKLDRFFNPDQPYQCILRSAALAKLDRISEALEMADQALYDEDTNEYVAYDLGLGFMNAEQFVLALRYYERSLRNHPDDIRTLAGIMFCYTQQHNWDPVLDLAEKIIAMDPFNYEAWVNKGSYYAKAEKWAEAIEAYEYALAIIPGDPDCLYLTARCYDGLNNREEAVRYLKEAAERAEGEQLATIYGVMGTLLNELGRKDEAIEAVWQSLEAGPKDTIPLLKAAYQFQDLKCLDEARAMYEAALKLQPKEYSILASLAEVSSRQEDYESAVGYYEQMHEIDDSASTLALWGGSLMSLNKFGEAVRVLRRSIEKEPMWQTYVLLATCDIELKWDRQMEADFRQAYALNPDNSFALLKSLCPEVGKEIESSGLLARVEKSYERWLTQREKELRALGVEQREKQAKAEKTTNNIIDMLNNMDPESIERILDRSGDATGDEPQTK